MTAHFLFPFPSTTTSSSVLVLAVLLLPIACLRTLRVAKDPSFHCSVMIANHGGSFHLAYRSWNFVGVWRLALTLLTSTPFGEYGFSNIDLRDDRGNQVEIPGLIGVDNPERYNANLTTATQTCLNNRTLAYSQGKVVGGSSILNGLCWTRSSQEDIDAWEALGNPGWGWDDLLPYFLKVSFAKIPY
jgi:hypothetical protein